MEGIRYRRAGPAGAIALEVELEALGKNKLFEIKAAMDADGFSGIVKSACYTRSPA